MSPKLERNSYNIKYDIIQLKTTHITIYSVDELSKTNINTEDTAPKLNKC